MKNLILFLWFFLTPVAAALAHPGIGIVIDSNGNVFYTDLVHVWKISPDGQRTIAVKDVHTHELYIDDQDNIYGEHEWYEGEATDKWGNYVWCLSSSGVFEKTIPDVEGFLNNNTLVRDNAGNSYWSKNVDDHQLLYKEGVSGENEQFTDHKFKDIRWMQYSKAEPALLVVDHLQLKKVSSNGNVTLLAENLKTQSRLFERVPDRHYVFGVWTNAAKEVYVAVYGAQAVKKFGVDGQMSTVFESNGGWSPCGGMEEDDGSLWIMEFSRRNKTRVRKISPDGKETLYED